MIFRPLKWSLLSATPAPPGRFAAEYTEYDGAVVAAVGVAILAYLGYYGWRNKDDHGTHS